MANSTLINEMQEMAITKLAMTFHEIQMAQAMEDTDKQHGHEIMAAAMLSGWEAIGLDKDYIRSEAFQLLAQMNHGIFSGRG